MRSLYNAASKGLFEPWIKKKEELRTKKHSAFMGSSGKISSGKSSSFLVSTLGKVCWNLEMLQREATKITSDFKWIPCWECFKEVHLFGLSKERCRSYLTLSSKYLPDVNNVLLSLPKKSGSKTNGWNRAKRRKHCKSYGWLLLGRTCQEKQWILHFLVSGNQNRMPFCKINPGRWRNLSSKWMKCCI